jgi:hypothetical protein
MCIHCLGHFSPCPLPLSPLKIINPDETFLCFGGTVVWTQDFVPTWDVPSPFCLFFSDRVLCFCLDGLRQWSSFPCLQSTWDTRHPCITTPSLNKPKKRFVMLASLREKNDTNHTIFLKFKMKFRKNHHLYNIETLHDGQEGYPNLFKCVFINIGVFQTVDFIHLLLCHFHL